MFKKKKKKIYNLPIFFTKKKNFKKNP